MIGSCLVGDHATLLLWYSLALAGLAGLASLGLFVLVSCKCASDSASHLFDLALSDNY